jgi:hypothetical protein
LRPHFQWMSDDRIIVTNAQHAALFIPTRVGPLHDLITLIRTKVNQISVQPLVWNLSQFLFFVVSMKNFYSPAIYLFHCWLKLLIIVVSTVANSWCSITLKWKKNHSRRRETTMIFPLETFDREKRRHH